MARSAKLLAVVLRSVDYGERDRVVTLFSRERGKLSAFARGARSSRRRFGGVLEPFTLLAAELTERGGDLWGLEDAAVERGFGNLRGDLARIACASYAVELTRELVRDAEPHEDLFDALVAYLGLLDDGPARPWDLRRFELDALRAAGLQPSITAVRAAGCRPARARDASTRSREGCSARPAAPPAAPGLVPSRPGLSRRCAGCSGARAWRRACPRGRRHAPSSGPASRSTSASGSSRAAFSTRWGRCSLGSEWFRLTAPAAGTYEGGPGSGRERESEGIA